nr:MAG TPA: hypothetical protein [Caudoviricetes sp.]
MSDKEGACVCELSSLNGPYRCYTTLTFDTFSILSAAGFLSIPMLGAIHLPPVAPCTFRFTRCLGTLPS